MSKRAIGIGLGVLILNSGYIAAFADPTIFYMANVVLHLGLGLLLMLAALVWLKRRPVESGAFLLCGIPALYLAVAGNTLQHRPALWVHIGLAVLAVAIIGARIFHQRMAGRMAFAAACAALVLLPAGAALYRKARPNPSD